MLGDGANFKGRRWRQLLYGLFLKLFQLFSFQSLTYHFILIFLRIEGPRLDFPRLLDLLSLSLLDFRDLFDLRLLNISRNGGIYGGIYNRIKRQQITVDLNPSRNKISGVAIYDSQGKFNDPIGVRDCRVELLLVKRDCESESRNAVLVISCHKDAGEHLG